MLSRTTIFRNTIIHQSGGDKRWLFILPLCNSINIHQLQCVVFDEYLPYWFGNEDSAKTVVWTELRHA